MSRIASESIGLILIGVVLAALINHFGPVKPPKSAAEKEKTEEVQPEQRAESEAR